MGPDPGTSHARRPGSLLHCTLTPSHPHCGQIWRAAIRRAATVPPPSTAAAAGSRQLARSPTAVVRAATETAASSRVAAREAPSSTRIAARSGHDDLRSGHIDGDSGPIKLMVSGLAAPILEPTRIFRRALWQRCDWMKWEDVGRGKGPAAAILAGGAVFRPLCSGGGGMEER